MKKTGKLLRILFALGLLILCVVLFLLYLRPDMAASLALGIKSLRVLALNIISALFLIAFLEKQPNLILRIIFLCCSFVILIESILLLQM